MHIYIQTGCFLLSCRVWFQTFCRGITPDPLLSHRYHLSCILPYGLATHSLTLPHSKIYSDSHWACHSTAYVWVTTLDSKFNCIFLCGSIPSIKNFPNPPYPLILFPDIKSETDIKKNFLFFSLSFFFSLYNLFVCFFLINFKL